MALSDYRNQIGKASQTLPQIDEVFEIACLWLLIEAFQLMKQEAKYDIGWKETRISAHLIGYMRSVRDSEDLCLQIDPESYLYRREILEGFVDPDKAPRIDIKVSGGWVYEDYYYGFESKILVERDWKTRRAYDLRTYYVEGFDRFVSGKYSPKIPKGCMVGYIIQGKPTKIVQKLNNLLLKRGRGNEFLKNRHAIHKCTDCYKSIHVRTSDKSTLALYHIFLSFE